MWLWSDQNNQLIKDRILHKVIVIKTLHSIYFADNHCFIATSLKFVVEHNKPLQFDHTKQFLATLSYIHVTVTPVIRSLVSAVMFILITASYAKLQLDMWLHQVCKFMLYTVDKCFSLLLIIIMYTGKMWRISSIKILPLLTSPDCRRVGNTLHQLIIFKWLAI